MTTGPQPTDRRAAKSRRARSELAAFAALLGLSSLAIAQPVFSLLNQDPTLYAGRARAASLVGFGLIVILGPPLALWAGEVIIGRFSAGARRWTHLALIALLSTMVLIPVAKATPVSNPAVILIAAAVTGGAIGIASRDRPWVHRWLTYMSPVSLVLLAAFVLASPATSTIFAGPAPTTDVGAPTDPAPPIVVVVFDELGTGALLDGEGQIDGTRFPHLARLSADATWYRDATTVAPATPLALSAILTGQYPEPSTTAWHPADFDGSLFSLLGEHYEVRATEPLTRFCQTRVGCHPLIGASTPDEIGSLLSLGLSLLEQSVDPAETSALLPLNAALRDHGRPVESFRSFVETLGPATERPPLDFLHVAYPHFPYVHLPSGRTYDPGGELFSVERAWQGPWVDDESAWTTRQRHSLQTQHADALLGELIDRLEELDRYDETLIVVTADHGSSFVTDRPSRTLTDGNEPDIVWVPLLVKAPHQDTGRIDDSAVESVDILPIIASHLAIEIPWTIDGTTPGRRDPETAHLVPWPALTSLPAEPDGLVHIDRAAGFEALLDLPPLNPTGHDPRWQPYRRGPYHALLGQRADELSMLDTTGPDTPVPGTLTTPRQLDVPTDGRNIPAYVSGTTTAGDEIAVAVDGTIAAVLAVHHQLDGRFWGVLPDHALTPGRHTVTAYSVTGPASAPQLTPLDLP